MSKEKLFIKYILLQITILFLIFSLSTKAINSDDLISESNYTFYVVNNGLHTGIVIPITDETVHKIEVLTDSGKFSYADFGWGDADYYQAGTGGVYLTIKALFFPSSSTVRVHGTDMSIWDITTHCIYSIRFNVTGKQFEKICSFINKSFIRENEGRFLKLSENNSGSTVFYKSIYHYHLFNTCNTWIADALKNGDMEISKKVIITADDLYEAISPFGEIIKQN